MATHARAERVDYDGGTGVVSLTGAPEIRDAESTVRAERVTLTEATGDAEAVGAVQVTYRAGSKADAKADEAKSDGAKADGAKAAGSKADAGPIHATGDRAVLRKESGVATFYGSEAPRGGSGGTTGLRARLWQGGSQVEAPVLVLGRAEGTLDAFGLRGGEAMPVRTVLVKRAEDTPGAVKESAAGGSKEKAQVLRVQSGRLHYADAARRAEFSQGVLLEDADGSMSSREAVATLLPAVKAGIQEEKAAPQEGLPGLAGGALERVTATGDVTVRQPGRVATGERAVYTAADGVFVMTGGAAGVEPKVTDEVNGSVRGASLRFRSGENSVTVDGRVKDGSPPTGDGRVHTQTKVKQ